LVPQERSSGAKRLQGGITKSGNTHLRRLLVEAAWHYRTNHPPGKRLRERRQGQPPEVVAYANRAMARLHRKYVRLVLGRARKSQVAVTAVARELAGFVWGLRLILATRQRQLPTIRMSCGSQSANISLTNRRVSGSLPFPIPGG
jgi:hypothetical protein